MAFLHMMAPFKVQNYCMQDSVDYHSKILFYILIKRL